MFAAGQVRNPADVGGIVRFHNTMIDIRREVTGVIRALYGPSGQGDVGECLDDLKQTLRYLQQRDELDVFSNEWWMEGDTP